MSHFLAWVSGSCAAVALLAAVRWYVPLAVFLGTASVLLGVVARHLTVKETT